MDDQAPEYTLEFLLEFDGRIHHLEKGYWLKFEIKRVSPTKERIHGLSYSFTLHAPAGARLVGFDNAHRVPPKGARFKRRKPAFDHWHRTDKDSGSPYDFKDAETLLDDFFDEVERVLSKRGIQTTVISVEDKGSKK